ncbi:MAG TPA: AtpZ/AtpI family protein [Lachnospiraceae bacterium]|jgi:F0F1-type ATP synthase assembly protein I|nr:AtpZ/AtpI family protein [Lachnospiraceae bacterium]
MKYKKNVYQSLILITQFSINMLVPIFLCTFLGIFLDKMFHTSFIVIILFFMGAMAGFRNVYIFAKKIYEIPAEHDNKLTGKSEDEKRL